MRFSVSALLLAALTAAVSAQNTTVGPCCSIDPNSVDIDTRQDWCRAQTNTCPEVCGGIGKLKQGGNLCDPNALNFTCICADNSQPNMSDYQQSLPGLECRAWFGQCINGSGTDLLAQEQCKSFSCGNKTTASATASPSSSGSASSTGGSTGSATASAASSSSSSGAAATAFAVARDYSTPALAAGMAALFGLAL